LTLGPLGADIHRLLNSLCMKSSGAHATGPFVAREAVICSLCPPVAVDQHAISEPRGKRAAAEGLLVDLQEGNGEEIPLPDASFDYVLFTLGAMFAPDQEKTASKLLRVCKPRGKIEMAKFAPDSFA
jgi:SAM-dependent methyltransferase